MEIKNKIILISGGSSGIGFATAKLLLEQRATVVIFARDETKLEKALTDLHKISENIYVVKADVTNFDDLQRVFQFIDDNFGRLDILINNAGLPADSITNTSEEDIDYTTSTNLIGYLRCAKMAYERMVQNRSAHIINIGSMSAATYDGGSDVYVAQKSGVEGFSRALRKSPAINDIKVSLIEPGLVDTNLITMSEKDRIAYHQAHKILKPEDVAELILFILTRREAVDIIEVSIKASNQII
ncbi:TPA: SDR family oxidoreductase [Candidatus Berkelbacteria bacterium]|uniref:Short-chain dehydrogenase/reductase SDR n=1 Tax=Berkelbacteria bacterium GW2011_GWE1_39_12 TaxID=1618337 RepID=A0A0G4B340_9BACT|nr:MAG: short-chain dehydrogenase/reductase SDR [Berkelbacteria bacterium GW2011_GWE1_39_12]HBO60087.1 SDR family oxidoreductase [Candidatus Berkelbacteria bacterium]